MYLYHYNLGLLSREVLAIHANRPALRYSDKTYSYGDLSCLVDKLAAMLTGKGMVKGDVIAIGHNKQPMSYALMLASLRLGIPYMCIDVASPLNRNQRIMAAGGAALLFIDDPTFQPLMLELARVHGCPLCILVEEDFPRISNEEHSAQLELARQVDGACIAYIMFTSGSTGIPKGVAVTHQNILHFVSWGTNRFRISPCDNFANLSPMYFDNSVFDFYVGLFSGASLTPIPRKILNEPYELVAYVGQMECTVWFSVPSLLMYLSTMKAMNPVSLPTLRSIVFGGEGYPKVELKKLYALFQSQAELVNVYGPTECTCICSAYTMVDSDFDDTQGLPTLGKLNENFDYQILGEDGDAAETGELCLIGPNVASGYFNDTERTSAAFVTITDPCRYSKRMYRTGDLVREENGMLYFVGRKDNQIKHMGYRIELEEIEHVLTRLPYVNQSAVIYKRTHASHGRLISFIASTEHPAEDLVLRELRENLPEYMIPAKIIIMAVLPKNQNGKVDKQKLQEIDID